MQTQVVDLVEIAHQSCCIGTQLVTFVLSVEDLKRGEADPARYSLEAVMGHLHSDEPYYLSPVQPKEAGNHESARDLFGPMPTTYSERLAGELCSSSFAQGL